MIRDHWGEMVTSVVPLRKELKRRSHFTRKACS